MNKAQKKEQAKLYANQSKIKAKRLASKKLDAIEEEKFREAKLRNELRLIEAAKAKREAKIRINDIRRVGIIKASKIVGGKAELGRLLGVSRQFVHSMTIDGNFFPATYAIKVDRLTNGQVRKEDLAPELYPE